MNFLLDIINIWQNKNYLALIRRVAMTDEHSSGMDERFQLKALYAEVVERRP